ncbi:MAG: type II toxin-antitoxin system VapC family toxin [Candidatus Limnocylindrales bacterium]
MNPTVIDASVALLWAFEDETDRAGALAVAEALQAGNLMVSAPPNFLLEVAASLVVGLRAGRIPHQMLDTVMGALAAIAIDEADPPHRFAEAALDVALRTGLRVPDAAYLETARRAGATLISADPAQVRAAEALGIAALVLRDLPPWDGRS